MYRYRFSMLLAVTCALVAAGPQQSQAGGGWLGAIQKGTIYQHRATKCEREPCEAKQRHCCRGQCGRGWCHCKLPPQGMVVPSMPAMTMPAMTMAPMMMAPMMMAPVGMVAAFPTAAPMGTVSAAPQWTYSQAAQFQQTPAAPGDVDGLLELYRALSALSKSAAPAAAPSRSPEASLEERVRKLERDVQELQGTVNLHSTAINALLEKCENK